MSGDRSHDDKPTPTALRSPHTGETKGMNNMSSPSTHTHAARQPIAIMIADAPMSGQREQGPHEPRSDRQQGEQGSPAPSATPISGRPHEELISRSPVPINDMEQPPSARRRVESVDIPRIKEKPWCHDCGHTRAINMRPL